MPAETIDDVVRALDEIIDWAWKEQNRLGYFAALYRRVTLAVKDGIQSGEFQNGPLLERLDVNFAGRYLSAIDKFRSGQTPTASWQVAFRAASRRFPIVLQHLLAGINAHINLDLGIAAAVTAPGGQIAGLQEDFNQINSVLGALVGSVEKEIAEVSPLIGLLETFSLKTETAIINFSLDKAREFAWFHAVRIATLSGIELESAIQELDAEVERLGEMIVSPPWLMRIQLWPIHLFETGKVRQVLDVLTRTKPLAAVAGLKA